MNELLRASRRLIGVGFPRCIL